MAGCPWQTILPLLQEEEILELAKKTKDFQMGKLFERFCCQLWRRTIFKKLVVKKLYSEIKAQNALKKKKIMNFFTKTTHSIWWNSFGPWIINTKMTSYPPYAMDARSNWLQSWLEFQNTPLDESKLSKKSKSFNCSRKALEIARWTFLFPMAPDVGTSTNLKPSYGW